jgi:hypothetical protein
MLILFDRGTPLGLARSLRGHSVVLAGTTKWSCVLLHLERIGAAVDAATPGSYYVEVEIPFPVD